MENPARLYLPAGFLLYRLRRERGPADRPS